MEKLFKESGTPTIMRERWFNMYEKAIKSTKNTEITKKVRNGKFRINNNKDVEILPDYPTAGKSSKQLLREHWKI